MYQYTTNKRVWMINLIFTLRLLKGHCYGNHFRPGIQQKSTFCCLLFFALAINNELEHCHANECINPYVAIGGGYFTPQTHFLSYCSETAWNCDKSCCDFS